MGLDFTQPIKFRVHDHPNASEDLNVFACIAPVRAKQSETDMIEWCRANLKTWAWLEPWMVIRDPHEAFAFKIRWC